MPVEVSPSIPQRLIPHFSVLCWLIGGNARYLNTCLVRGDVSHCNNDAALNPYGCVLPKPSHYIVGNPLTKFRNPDPTSEAVWQHSQSERDETWKAVRKDFLKWLSGQKKEAYFEGEQEIAPVIEWDNMMRYYFVVTPVENPITQACLAVITFKNIAQS